MLSKHLGLPKLGVGQNHPTASQSRSSALPTGIQGALPPAEAPWRTQFIRTIAVLALVASLIYLGWRIGFTLNMASWWISIPLLVCEIHAVMGLALFTFSLWSVDSKPSTWRVEATSSRIAVLIPTYNEEAEILLPTIAAAVALRLPHETWVLDDGNRPWVQQLATGLGAKYLNRPEHKHAKAGNINHALQHIDADFVAILDADHVALPDLLTNTLGYFDDPRVALVQTPQDFYNLDSFEHARNNQSAHQMTDRSVFHEQSLFYRLLQPGKNRWGAAFWCGTSAIVRVTALQDVGGIATETITEDIHTTLWLHRRGWKTIYHNEVLARGLAASDVTQYLTQRLRWGTGAMQVLRTDNPITASNLTTAQRLAYSATIYGWFDAWRSLAYLMLPMMVLATGAVPIRAPWATFLMAFGVTFALQQLAMLLLSRGFYRPLLSTMFELVRMPATLLATLTLLRPHDIRFQVTSKGRIGNERQRMPVPRLLIALAVASFATAIWFLLTSAGLTPVQYNEPWVAYGAAFWLCINTTLVMYAINRIHSSRYGAERRRSIRFATTLHGSFDQQRCDIDDISLTGAQIRVSAAAGTVNSAAKDEKDTSLLTMAVDGVQVKMNVSVRSQRMLPSGQIQYGLEFSESQHKAQAKLALALFNARIIPEIEDVPQIVYA